MAESSSPPPQATTVWSALLAQTPVPQNTPLPEPVESPVDGTYVLFDPGPPQWWVCRRCADYRPAGGNWRLQLDRGVMRIYYDVTGWRSLASFALEGDRLFLFNDPYCPPEVGEYRWQRVDGSLVLETITDPCSFGLRGQNFSRGLWATCEPPSGAVSPASSWMQPPGCADNLAVLPTVIPTGLPVRVSVHPGDVRRYEWPPAVRAIANTEDMASPEGINISFGEASVGYGLNRVLWQPEDWIEATTELPFGAIGVQFHGDYIMGWARVLFDGVEVWRGDTAAIWSHLGQHAGYVEVAGYAPGRHTLRVERLPVDSRPVRVLFFGFDEEGVAGQPPGSSSRPNSGG
jgi:hypothetical protein